MGFHKRSGHFGTISIDKYQNHTNPGPQIPFLYTQIGPICYISVITTHKTHKLNKTTYKWVSTKN